jgi:hypothetical protein
MLLPRTAHSQPIPVEVTAVHGNAKLYLSAQLLNTFDTSVHVKSYQWLRARLDIKGTQFGLAVTFDEFGPDPDLRLTAGLFVRREIP